MKKIMFIICTIFILSIGTAIAEEFPPITYEEYTQLIEEGHVDENVSYEQLKLFMEEPSLEEGLENNPNFTRVKRSTLGSLKAGDIIITNATVCYKDKLCSRIPDHAAIAISDYEILHIAGFNKNPETINMSDFIKKYDIGYHTYIKVYRCNNQKSAKKAAKWAVNTYKNSKAKYSITSNMKSTDKVYCSKLVYQAYYYGVGKKVVADYWTNQMDGAAGLLVGPYTLINTLNSGSYSFDKEGNL